MTRRDGHAEVMGLARERRCEVCGAPTGKPWARLCLNCWRAPKDAERIEAGRHLRPLAAKPRVTPTSKEVLEAAAELVRRAQGEPPPW